MCNRISTRGSVKQQAQAFISSRRRPRRGPLQGDVQEEGQGEEWSDAGRHPPRHFPAADLTRPNHIHAEISHTCLHLILFH